MIYRVLRGGSYNRAWDLRTTDRDRYEPVDRFKDIGFRIVVKRRKKP